MVLHIQYDTNYRHPPSTDTQVERLKTKQTAKKIKNKITRSVNNSYKIILISAERQNSHNHQKHH